MVVEMVVEIMVKGQLSSASITSYLWYGCIEARYLQIRVGGRRAVSLHGDQPWWRELVLALEEGRREDVYMTPQVESEHHSITYFNPIIASEELHH